MCVHAHAAVSTEHSIIVIAKCWAILYWSKNQLQTLCYENFLMLCLMVPHSEAVTYYTALCWSVLLDILQHCVWSILLNSVPKPTTALCFSKYKHRKVILETRHKNNSYLHTWHFHSKSNIRVVHFWLCLLFTAVCTYCC